MRSTDVYRALLWCYPADFRREYGAEMVRTFTEQLTEARRAGGSAAAAIWAATLADLPTTALKEHAHVISHDLRYALRLLSGSPGFTAVAVLSLALGMGANTAIFSLLDSVLMQTLPVRAPHELVLVTDPGSAGAFIGSQSGTRSLLTYAEFRALQDRTTTLASVMAASSNLRPAEARIDGGEPETVAVRLVSASYFETLGVGAARGRTFDARREPAPGTAPFAVISDHFWRHRFGGAADAVGRTLDFDGTAVSIVGVAPPGFFGETVGERPDAWVPLAMQGALMPGRDWLRDAAGNAEKVMWLQVFGRLRPGTSIDSAQADAGLIFQQELTSFYASLGDAETRARFLDQELRVRSGASGVSTLRERFSEPLLVLLGAAVLVLLIACANLGNLLLARTTARAREMTVRLALGASRGRLIRQLLTESLALATLGAVAGLATAWLLRRGLLRLASDTPITLPAALDLRTLAFVVVLTLAVGVLLGLLPALRMTNVEAGTGLREQGRGIAGSLAWMRIGKAVIVGQLALSLPLLVGAGLLVRTLMNLQQVDLGYAKAGLLTVRVDARAAGYDAARRATAIDQLLERVRAVPGVAAAAYSNNGLFAGSDSGDRILVEGYTPNGDNDAGSSYDQVGPDYFSTLGIPIRLGREITAADRAGSRAVCVINDAFARRFFDGRNPLGQHVTQVYADERHTYEVVGVVRDSRQGRLRGEVEHRFYVPATQPAAEINGVSFLIRPARPAAAVVNDVRRAIQAAEPRMRIVAVGTVAEAVDGRMVQDRLLARMSAAFGVVAVLLAAIGIYGVLSYGVARRTSEIGIRKALGAQPGAVVAMVLRETAWLLVGGVAAGLALAFATVRLIESRLYALAPTDPLTFILAVAGLSAVAALATWLPASRASRVDPLIALRQE